MRVEFRCRQCRKAIAYDPSKPYRCPHCGESYAGDMTYASASPEVTQCALCRAENLARQKWSQRYLGPSTYIFLFVLVIPSRGMSLLLPFLAKYLLDYLLPHRMLCRQCGAVHSRG